MTNVQESEADGWFWLSYLTEPVRDECIGRGGVATTARFESAEGRRYFRMLTEEMERSIQRIADLESELRYLRTVKGANENLRAVRVSRKTEGKCRQ